MLYVIFKKLHVRSRAMGRRWIIPAPPGSAFWLIPSALRARPVEHVLIR